MITASLPRQLLALALVLAWAVPAYAQDPVPFTRNKPSAEAHLGYGAYTGDGRVNPYGIGLGLRGGTTFPSNFYLGGLLEYYFGESATRSDGFFETIETSANFWLLQVEPGYDYALSDEVILRPHWNLGFLYANREECIEDVCDKENDANLSMAPSATVLYKGNGYILTFTLRYSVVGTAADRSSGDAFLMSVGVAAPLEQFGIRLGE